MLVLVWCQYSCIPVSLVASKILHVSCVSTIMPAGQPVVHNLLRSSQDHRTVQTGGKLAGLCSVGVWSGEERRVDWSTGVLGVIIRIPAYQYVIYVVLYYISINTLSTLHCQLCHSRAEFLFRFFSQRGVTALSLLSRHRK